MLRTPARAPLAVALVALTVACHPTSDESRGAAIDEAASAIRDGAEDTEHRAVLAIYTMLPTGDELCTGYLVMPDLVMTARHCVAPVVNPTAGCSATDPTKGAQGGEALSPGKLFVSRNDVLDATTVWLDVKEVTVLPGSEGAQLCGRDLALLRLAKPIDDVAPIALAIGAAPVVGDGFTAVGYGLSDPANADSADRRRSRTGLSIEQVGAGDRTVDEEWIADTGPCGGDSGSPALNADGASFGVMSRGPKATCKSMIYERVDVHAAFLIEQATLSANRLGVAVPAWATATTGEGGGGPASTSQTTGQGGSGPGSGGQGGSDATGTGGAAEEPTEDAGCAVSSTGTAGSGDGGATGVLAVGALVTALRRRRRVGT